MSLTTRGERYRRSCVGPPLPHPPFSLLIFQSCHLTAAMELGGDSQEVAGENGINEVAGSLVILSGVTVSHTSTARPGRI